MFVCSVCLCRLSDFVTGQDLYPLTSLFSPFISDYLDKLGEQMKEWCRQSLQLDKVRFLLYIGVLFIFLLRYLPNNLV